MQHLFNVELCILVTTHLWTIIKTGKNQNNHCGNLSNALCMDEKKHLIDQLFIADFVVDFSLHFMLI